MLYCMAMTNEELENLNDEICRILKPNGINIYTVRHINDGDFKRGIHHGENLYAESYTHLTLPTIHLV